MIERLVKRWMATEQNSTGDAPLIRRFVYHSDQEAFSQLVYRHGPMVLSVAKRALGNEEDAHDVFQAAFLILARKARSVEGKSSIAAFLFGVTQRVSWNLRRKEQLRQKKELAGQRELPVNDEPSEEAAKSEIDCFLNQELSRLPYRYRTPLVLCHLQGLSREEAASQLGWPAGTVAGRLARARELLKTRLLQRGFAPALVASALAVPASVQSLPSLLVQSTTLLVSHIVRNQMIPKTGAALALAQGVLQMMFLKKAMATVAVCVLCSGMGLASYFTWRHWPGGAVVYVEKLNEQDVAKTEVDPDLKRFDGWWQWDKLHAVTEKLERTEQLIFKNGLYSKAFPHIPSRQIGMMMLGATGGGRRESESQPTPFQINPKTGFLELFTLSNAEMKQLGPGSSGVERMLYLYEFSDRDTLRLIYRGVVSYKVDKDGKKETKEEVSSTNPTQQQVLEVPDLDRTFKRIPNPNLKSATTKTTANTEAERILHDQRVEASGIVIQQREKNFQAGRETIDAFCSAVVDHHLYLIQSPYTSEEEKRKAAEAMVAMLEQAEKTLKTRLDAGMTVLADYQQAKVRVLDAKIQLLRLK